MCIKEEKTTLKREYKDTVFIDLFTSWTKPVSLYNALSSSNVPENAKIKQLQISNALYTSLRCDLAFIVENELIVIIEHQSTINMNMPTRLLLYISMIYLNVLDEEARYARALKKIPTPRFFVLYNGDEKLAEKSELRLSDAFKLKEGEKPQLELIVPVININYGQNEEIMKRCNTLYEYSYLIDRIKKYKEVDKEHCFELAIEDCLKNGILVEYLKTQQKRVRNMLQAEYSFETELAVRGAEEREAGILLGMQQGIQQGMQKGLQKGMQQGMQKEKIGIAQIMKNENCPISLIIKATGLSQKEIEQL